MKNIIKKILFQFKSRELKNWININGDKTLRLDYDNLNENSIVFDLGGYEGQWTSDIYSKYNCFIYIFEPVPEYFERIKKRFSKNKKIIVHCFGLGAKTEKLKINIKEDGSSIHSKETKQKVEIEIKSISEFLKEFQINKIDLMKINIEGEEYNLLDNIIEQKIINIINNLQIQFHKIDSDAVKKRDDIREKLQKTHNLTWDYPFVWENWKLK